MDGQLDRFSMSSINCDAGNARGGHDCQLEHLAQPGTGLESAVIRT